MKPQERRRSRPALLKPRWKVAFALLFTLSTAFAGAQTLLLAPRAAVPTNAALADAGLDDPVAEMQRIDRTLDELAHFLDIADLETSAVVQSRVLGASGTAQVLAAQYTALAASSASPLREALLAWNDAFAFAPPESILERLQAADEYPLEFQVAAASLLYALQDATWLQRSALESLDAQERHLLFSTPSLALQATGPTPDPSLAATLEEIAQITRTQVDLGMLQQAGQILAATLSTALPVLQDWRAGQPASGDTPRHKQLQAFLSAHSPDSIEAQAPSERLALVSDALALAASWLGHDVSPRLAPRQPAMGEPLSAALQDLLASNGASLDDEALRSQLHQADALPPGLQAAIATIVVNFQAWNEAFRSSEPPSATQMLVHQIRLINAIQQAAPTLDAWGLLYENLPGLHLARSAADAPLLPPALFDLAQGTASDSLAVAQAIRGSALLSGVELPASAVPTLPPPGALADSLARLYEHADVPFTSEQRDALRDAVLQLPEVVERNTARVLDAQIDALESLQTFYAGVTDADRALLESGEGGRAIARILAGQPASPHDVATLTQYFQLASAAHDAYYRAADAIAAAMEAATADIERAIEPPAADPPKASLVAKALAWLPSINLIGTASAQSIPGEPPLGSNCPNIPTFSICAQDIWFKDPALGAVVIGGFLTTEYDASVLGLPTTVTAPGHRADMIQRQFLTLDLGGNDVYRNNAGGAFLSFMTPNAVNIPPTSKTDLSTIAVAIDLGGNDNYRVPPAGFASEAIQGAGIGGIGLLWDRRGNDQYDANNEAQGFGGGFTYSQRADGACDRNTANTAILFPINRRSYCIYGVFGLGLLVDGEGNDVYTAKTLAQGAGNALDIPGVNIPAAPIYSPLETPRDAFGGAGLLVDLSGADSYRMLKSASTIGQGGADAGIGILIDAAGADSYRDGSQGLAQTGGLGVLVDLDGDDTYSRRKPATTIAFGDGECWTSLRFPKGDPTLVLDAQNNFEDFYQDAADRWLAGVGVFADRAPPGACTLNVQDLVPGSDQGDPEEIIDSVLGSNQDADSDGWSDGIEGLQNRWDSSDPTSYPAGLPQDPPPGWPSGEPYPPSPGGRELPYGSSYLVNIPGIFVLGDVSSSPYLNYFYLTIDLGGPDSYFNSAGGAGQVVVDVGDDGDSYRSGHESQGFLGYLLDLGGDDFYEATTQAQGGAKSSLISAQAGVLFDAAGNDEFIITSTLPHAGGQGSLYIEPDGFLNGVESIGIFVDAIGEDVYRSPTQGTVVSEDFAGNKVALFLDLGGQDEYRPVGIQGRVLEMQSPATTVTAAFVDAGGDDTYAGSRQSPAGPDVSQARNNRIRATNTFGPTSTEPTGGDTLRDEIFVDRDPTIEPTFSTSPLSLDIPEIGVAIGSPADDTYPRNYALLIDPEGEDRYLNNAGGSILRGTTGSKGVFSAGGQTVPYCPCEATLGPDAYSIAALLIDLAGDDEYGSPSAGFRGASLSPETLQDPQLLSLAPVQGHLVQGAGFLGSGILVDQAGHDSYVANSFSQGFGMIGFGLLWDREGDDDYAIDPAVVANPSVDGSLFAWQEVVDGALRVKARKTTDACDYDVVPDPRAMAGPPNVGGGSVTFALFDVSTDRWNTLVVRPTLSTCGTPPELNPLRISTFPSNQIDPVFQNNRVVWTDDRNGEQDLFIRDRLAAAPESLLVAGPPGSNQGHAATHGDTLVWQDDRDGLPDIYMMDMTTRVQTLLSTIPGAHTLPSVSESFVTWQTSSPSTGLDVAIHFRPTGETRVLALPGDQTNMDAGGEVVVFQDATSDGPRILRYLWHDDELVVVEAAGAHPTVDRSNPFRFAWASSTGIAPDAESATGSPYWEIRTRDLQIPQSVLLSSTRTRIENRLLQGSAWQAGLGLLLEEGGLDRYVGGLFSQGGAFSFGEPISTFQASGGNTRVDEGAHAVLFDGEGNDAYTARRFSQGAHVGMESALNIGLGQAGAIRYAEIHQDYGLLVDLRGADTYGADTRSQGFASFAEGLTAFSIIPGSPPSVAPDPRLYHDDSAGLLADLGGFDAYTYGDSFEQVQFASVGSCTEALVEVDEQVSNPNADAAFAALRAPCGQVDAAIAGSPAGDAVEEVRDAADLRARSGRDNSVWRQFTRRGTAASGEAQVLNEFPGCDNRKACPGVVNVGGVGLDVPAFDNLERGVKQAANQLFTITIQATDESGLEDLGTTVQGSVRLRALVTPAAGLPAGLEVKRTEFFLNERFQGYGLLEAGCTEGCRWDLPWSTDSEAFPDGEYEVLVRAHLGPGASASGATVGFADKVVPLRVDNRPRILGVTLSPVLFSPFPYALDAPGLPQLAFRLSTDPQVPAGDGWAKVTVFNEQGDAVRSLTQQHALVDGPQQLTWDGRSDAAAVVASGLYKIRIEATDDLADPARTRVEERFVTLDGDPPRKGCVEPLLVPICNESLRVNLQSTTGLDPVTGEAEFRLRMTRVDASEMRRVHVFVRDEPEGAWIRSEQSTAVFSLLLAHQDHKRVIVLFEDLAGNLECAPSCDGHATASLPRGDLTYLTEAMQRKLGANEILGRPTSSTFRVDLELPRILLPPFDRVFEVDGRFFELTDLPRVGPASDLTIRYNLAETTSLPVGTQLHWESLQDLSLARSFDATPLPLAGTDGRFAVEWSDWGALMQGWPQDLEGLLLLRLEAEDQAGNQARPFAASLLLDRTPPRVQETAVTYPDGRFHGVEGDHIAISVKAADPELQGIPTVDGELRIRLNASSISAAPGMDALPLFYSPAAGRFQRDDILIEPPPGLDLDTLTSTQFELGLEAIDPAGNVNRTTLTVVLGEPRLEPRPLRELVGIRELRVDWTTERDAQAYLEYGPVGNRSQETPLGSLSQLHRLEATDLIPGQVYEYRIIAIDASGAREAGPIHIFRTRVGLELDLDVPDAGIPVGGIVELTGVARVTSNASAEPQVEMRIRGPALPGGERLIAEGPARNQTIRLDLVSDGLPDGEYVLHVKATFAGETVTAEYPRFVVDNTPPTLRVVAPLDGASFSRPPTEVALEVADARSAINASSARVRLADGFAVPATPTFDADQGLLRLTGLDGLPDGIVRLSITVADDAGNVGSSQLAIRIDSASPQLAEMVVTYPTGQTSARPGQTVRVTARSADDQGISSVSLDLSPLGQSGRLMFTPMGDAYQADVRVPLHLADMTLGLPLAVVDRVGNRANETVVVLVDKTPPVIATTRTLPVGMDQALIIVQASENSTATLSYGEGPAHVSLLPLIGKARELQAIRAQGVLPPGALSAEGKTHLFLAPGLEPGGLYTFEATVIDGSLLATNASVPLAFAPKVVPPVAVTLVRALAAGPGLVKVEWTPSPDWDPSAIQFQTYRATADDFQPIGLARGTQFLDADTVPGQTYRYYVRSQNLRGEQGPISPIAQADGPARPQAEASPVLPALGTEATEFVFQATLTGTASSDPVTWLVLNGKSYRFPDVGQDCAKTCTKYLALRLPAATLRDPGGQYHVEVFDAGATLRAPAEGSLAAPTVVVGPLEAATPAPAPAATPLLLLCVLWAGACVTRRRRSLP